MRQCAVVTCILLLFLLLLTSGTAGAQQALGTPVGPADAAPAAGQGTTPAQPAGMDQVKGLSPEQKGIIQQEVNKRG
ncbi:MAG: hypothetical protein PHU71_04290, partial [Candidatus Gracilibacteria bacterium]|nr:hypothetical protein [Candidatus Gracilibacteria bacterium]